MLCSKHCRGRAALYFLPRAEFILQLLSVVAEPANADEVAQAIDICRLHSAIELYGGILPNVEKKWGKNIFASTTSCPEQQVDTLPKSFGWREEWHGFAKEEHTRLRIRQLEHIYHRRQLLHE